MAQFYNDDIEADVEEFTDKLKSANDSLNVLVLKYIDNYIYNNIYPDFAEFSDKFNQIYNFDPYAELLNALLKQNDINLTQMKSKFTKEASQQRLSSNNTDTNLHQTSKLFYKKVEEVKMNAIKQIKDVINDYNDRFTLNLQ